jgi:hypothetical protein
MLQKLRLLGVCLRARRDDGFRLETDLRRQATKNSDGLKSRPSFFQLDNTEAIPQPVAQRRLFKQSLSENQQV